MKPEAMSSVPNQERIQAQPSLNVEHNSSAKKFESNVESGIEKSDKASEISAIAADVSFTTILPTPVSDTNSVVDDTTTTNAPLVAADDDLIEKEWVDRAKKIIAETQNNPHKREDEVSKLQVDYIKKRFGRELGTAE